MDCWPFISQSAAGRAVLSATSDCGLLMLFPDLDSLSNESHYLKRHLNNVCPWTPADDESYSNRCPWSSFHFSPAVKAQTSPAGCDWVFFSFLFFFLLSVLSEVVTAAPGAASCSQGSCHFALTCVIYWYHPCDKNRGRVMHLGEETRGAYLDAPTDPASTWNSTARHHGNKRAGVVACSVISLPPSDTYRAA